MKKRKITKVGDFLLLPPASDLCQECAIRHKKDQPHDKNSLYYQILFYGLYGRYPTWEDALRHCRADVRSAWEMELRKRGVWK